MFAELLRCNVLYSIGSLYMRLHVERFYVDFKNYALMFFRFYVKETVIWVGENKFTQIWAFSSKRQLTQCNAVNYLLDKVLSLAGKRPALRNKIFEDILKIYYSNISRKIKFHRLINSIDYVIRSRRNRNLRYNNDKRKSLTLRYTRIFYSSKVTNIQFSQINRFKSCLS